MKNLLLVIFSVFAGFLYSQEKSNKAVKPIYSFTVKDINGKKFSFKKLKGKKIMIVNTASKCGLTPQYKTLEELYQKYKDQGFVIVGFPANNFAEQEPGTNEEIAQFCQANYGVTFPMMSKVSVKGEDEAPIYKYLKNKSENGFQDSEIRWNFQKYLINGKGYLEKVLDPMTDFTSEEVINWISNKK